MENIIFVIECLLQGKEKNNESNPSSSIKRMRLHQHCIGTQPSKFSTRPVVKKGPNGPIRIRRETKKWSTDETNSLKQAVRRQVQNLCFMQNQTNLLTCFNWYELI